MHCIPPGIDGRAAAEEEAVSSVDGDDTAVRRWGGEVVGEVFQGGHTTGVAEQRQPLSGGRVEEGEVAVSGHQQQPARVESFD